MEKEREMARVDTKADSSDSRTAPTVAPDVIAEYIEAPWRMDSMGMSILGRDVRDGGDSKIADIRGWGHLTGTGGGLALSEDLAEAVQRARGNILAAAPDLLAVLKALTQDSRFSLAIGGNPNTVAALVAQVDAAIAKAEGR